MRSSGCQGQFHKAVGKISPGQYKQHVPEWLNSDGPKGLVAFSSSDRCLYFANRNVIIRQSKHKASADSMIATKSVSRVDDILIY